MTNTDEIARLRGIDFVAAVEFWNQVNTVAQPKLSTHEVLMLLRAQGDDASTITAQALALTVQASTETALPLLPNSADGYTDDATPQRAGSDLETTFATKYNLNQVEAKELCSLLTTMLPLGFTRSKQLSHYIVKHQLGYRYPNISGIVKMEQNGTEWDFTGGFPPKIYAIVCDELDLYNEGTRARPVGFISFKELMSNGN